MTTAAARADNTQVTDIIASLKTTLEGIGPTIKSIQERQELVVKESNSRLDAIDLMIKELRERIDRGARIDREVGARVDRNGQVQIAPSRELSEFVVKATIKERNAMSEADRAALAEKRELSTLVGADGGFLIPQDRIPEILQMITVYGAARRNAMVIPMKNNTRLWPTLVAGVSTYWITENGALTESLPQFGTAQIVAKKLAGLCHWSSELYEDADSDLGAIITDLFLRAIAQEEDKQFFIGTGAGADPFVGWLYDPGVNVVTMPATKTTFAAVTPEDLLAMQTATPTPGLVGAKYYLHRSVLAVLQQLKTTGAAGGQYVWQAPTAAAPGTIWGYPYEIVEIMPGTGTASQAGKPFVAFGNARNIYFGDRKSIEIATSRDYAFNKDQTYMRILERVGVKVALAQALTILKTAAA